MRPVLPILATIALIAGCGGGGDAKREACAADMKECPQAAVAVLQATQGNQVAGVLRLTPKGDGVAIVGDVTGLQPNAQHAFHIHEFGDASAPDGAAAGSHFNPGGHPHGAPGAAPHHAGDLGNIAADAQGKAHVDVVAHGVSLCCEHAIIGRSIVIHAKQDDLASQPAGNAGARVAVGVIGVAKP